MKIVTLETIHHALICACDEAKSRQTEAFAELRKNPDVECYAVALKNATAEYEDAKQALADFRAESWH